MTKTLAILVAGIMVSVIMLGNLDTYSWFISSSEGSVSVAAAVTEDIIDTFELITDGKDKNTIAIRIRKSEERTDNPLVYFEIEGEAVNYILHLNPLRLEERGLYVIPIETDVNLNQFANLLYRSKNIEGTLRVKYLNEFIDESYELSFSPKYLRNRLLDEIINKGARLEQEKNNKMRMMSFIETPEEAGENLSKQDSEEITIAAITSLAELLEWQRIGLGMEVGEKSDEELFHIGIELTSNQEFLMDIMYPGLKKYLESLQEYISVLKSKLEDKNAQMASLDEKLAALESQYEELLEENASLVEQINNMAPIKLPVTPPSNTIPDITPPPATGGGDTAGGGVPDSGGTPETGAQTGDGSVDGVTGEATGDGTVNDGTAVEDTGAGETPGDATVESDEDKGTGDSNVAIPDESAGESDEDTSGQEDSAVEDSTDDGADTVTGSSDSSGTTAAEQDAAVPQNGE